MPRPQSHRTKLYLAALAASLMLGVAVPFPVRAGTSTGISTTSPVKKNGPLDVNSATKEELMALPGIGDAYAQKIIDGRPYRNKTQLKSVIPEGVYKKIASAVVARQAKKSS